MFAPLVHAWAFIRARPALAVAAGGVGLAAAVPVLGRLRSGAAAPQAAPPPAAASAISGYGLGLTSGADLAVGSLASQYAEGNGLILGELGRLRDQVAGSVQPPMPAPVPGAGAGGVIPPAAPLPVIPPTVIPPTPAAAPPAAPLSAGQVAAIVTRAGHPEWATMAPAYARVSEAELMAWVGRAEQYAAAHPPPAAAPIGGTSFIYTVVRGDSLSAIAARFGHPGGWPALYQLNRATVGSNPNLIYPGQRLTVIRTR